MCKIFSPHPQMNKNSKFDFTSAFKDTTTLQVPQKKVSTHKKTRSVDKLCRDNTLHEAIVPEDAPYTRIDLAQPIDTHIFSYDLDLFQRISCIALERDENVLVCAHTASGKTAIAEYAIHLALKRKQRVVYTSPIKALSNQKYRELKLKFDDVGLITGDSTLNPKASVLVMTTEILRNMLYRSNELVGEIKFVIFDEIHYMTDRERGVVWEECIILSRFNCVFLSATLPNANEFAEWVVNVQGRVCHIVSNDRRVVPLIHYVFPVGGKGLFKIKGGGEGMGDEDDETGGHEGVGHEGIGGETRGGVDDEMKGGVDDEMKGGETRGDEDGEMKGFKTRGEIRGHDEVNDLKTKTETRDFKTKGHEMKDLKTRGEMKNLKKYGKEKGIKKYNNKNENNDKHGKMSSRTRKDDKTDRKNSKKGKNENSTCSSDDRLAGGDDKRSKSGKTRDDPSDSKRTFNRGRGRKEDGRKKRTNERSTKKVAKATQRALKAYSPTSTVDFNVEIFNEAIQNIRKSRVDYADIRAIIGLLTEKSLLPVIVFSFRRKECENFATCLEEDYNTAEEKERITLIFNRALETLRAEDRTLSPIQSMLPLLVRGIGIHHSGLLPVLKEIIEILFSLNLVKVLFATETFSIGLNMPAKCVLFTTLFKFDGEKMRTITSGEYIQMSGRAGRRGIDKEGICISILTEAINIESAVALFNGRSNPLRSAFHLTYNMILNLLKIEGLDPVYVLERSFFHYQKIKGVERLRDTVNYFYGLIGKVESVDVGGNEDYKEEDGKNEEDGKGKNEEMEGVVNNERVVEKEGMVNNNFNNDDNDDNNDNNDNNLNNDNNDYSLNTVNVNTTINPNNNVQAGDFEFLNDALSHRRLEDIGNLSELLVKGRLIDVILNVNGFPIYLQNCIISSAGALNQRNKKTDSNVNLEVVVLLYNRINKMKRKCIKLHEVRAIYDARVKINNKRLGRKYAVLYGTPVDGHYCTICEGEVGVACLEERCFFDVLERFMSGANIGGFDGRMVGREEEVPVGLSSAMTVECRRDGVLNGDMSGYVDVCGGSGEDEERIGEGRIGEDERDEEGRDEGRDEKGKNHLEIINEGMNDKEINRVNVQETDRSNSTEDTSSTAEHTSPSSAGTALQSTASPVLKRKILKYLNNVYNAKNGDLFLASRIDHIDQCTKMIQVLRRLDYYDNNSITVKGRVACELNTEELVLTELIFNGHFLKLSVVEVVSVLSCLVFTEREDAEVSEQSLRNYKIIEEVVHNVVKVMNQVGLNVQVEDFAYSNELMDVVRMWAAGASFESVTARTQVFEGSIVRCLKRLDEMLRQLSCAARAIGNLEMERVFGEGISKIKRDIVFCNSLYL